MLGLYMIGNMVAEGHLLGILVTQRMCIEGFGDWEDVSWRIW